MLKLSRLFTFLIPPSSLSNSRDHYRPLLTDTMDTDKMTFWSLFATCVACLGGFLFGYDTGVVGGILIAPSFQLHFGINPHDKVQEASINGNIVSTLQIGCFLGALLATGMADRYGRKKSIMAASFVFTIGGIFQVIGLNLGMMYAGRVIAGVGVGALSMLVPIYIAEIAHQQQRGKLGSLWMFFIATGLAASYWCNYIARRVIDDQDNRLWRIPLFLQIVPSVLLFIGMFFLFETPRWLCAHGQSEEAHNVLVKVRNTSNVHQEINLILESIDAELKDSATSNWKQLFCAQNKRRLLLGCILQVLQQLTGVNVINYFGPTVFRSIGLSSSEAELLATGVYGILKMMMVLVGSTILIERFGRRPLLVWGGLAMSICLYSVSISVSNATTEPNEGEITISAGVGIAFMYLFACFFALSWGPCPWIFCSEIFPMGLRATSTSLTTAVNWFSNAVIGKISPIMLATSVMGTYIFFGTCCVIGSTFCFFFIPETMGKTLEEIYHLF